MKLGIKVAGSFLIRKKIPFVLNHYLPSQEAIYHDGLVVPVNINRKSQYKVEPAFSIKLYVMIAETQCC